MALVESLKSVIDCQICLHKMEDARTLKCGHTFCFICLKKILHSTTITCPVCRTNFAVIRNNLDSISCKSYTFQSIIDTVSKNVEQEQLNHSLCSNQNCAKNYTKKCTTCVIYFCDKCAKEHLNIKGNKCKIVSCDESDICSVHNDKLIAFYCEDCKEMICSVCFLDKHKGHKISNIDDYKDKVTVDLLGAMDLQKKLVSELRDNNDQQLELIKNEELKITEFEFQINERRMFLQSLIDQIETEQYSKLFNIRNSLSKERQKLSIKNNKIDKLLKIFSEVTESKDFTFVQLNKKKSEINDEFNILRSLELQNIKSFTIEEARVDLKTIESNIQKSFNDYTMITTDLVKCWKLKFKTSLEFQPIGVVKNGKFLYLINNKQKSVYYFDVKTQKCNEINLTEISQPLKLFCVDNCILIYDCNGDLWKVSKNTKSKIWQNLSYKCSMTFDGNILDINTDRTLIQEKKLSTKKLVFEYKADHGYLIEDVIKTEKYVYLIKLVINSDIHKIIKYDASKKKIANCICFIEDFQYLNISNNGTNNLYLYNNMTFEISRLYYISFKQTKIIKLSETDVSDKISCATDEYGTEVYIVNDRKQSVECYVDK